MKSKNHISRIGYKRLSKERLEKELVGSNNYNVTYFGRARAGLLHVLNALCSSDSNIVMSSFTLPDLHKICELVNCEIRYFDYLEKSLIVDVKLISEMVDAQTSAIILTGYNTRPLEQIEHLKRSFPDVIIIEDCAISWLPSVINSPVYPADYTVLSFSSFKLINSYWGGAVVSKSVIDYPNGHLPLKKFLEQCIKTIRFQLVTSSLVFPLLMKVKKIRTAYLKGSTKTSFRRSETNEWDSSLNARPLKLFYWNLGFSLKMVNRRFKRRNELWRVYNENLSDYKVPESENQLTPSCRWYPLMVKDQNDLTEIIKEMNLVYDLDIARSPYSSLPRTFGFDANTPNANCLEDALLCLPINEKLSCSHVDRICKSILKYNTKLINFNDELHSLQS